MRDSMVDMAKMNRIQNAGLTIERNRQARQMADARSRLEQERTTRRIGFAALGLGLLVLIGVVSMMYYTGRMRRRSHSALQRMSSIREQFYTNVTHEFRTPLTVILGLSDELQKDAADEAEVRAKAQIIERQGRGLLTLINHLLDIAKIKLAMNLLDREPAVSFAAVAERCGFDTYPNFVRSFKNVCGITPTEYRKKSRQLDKS